MHLYRKYYPRSILMDLKKATYNVKVTCEGSERSPPLLAYLLLVIDGSGARRPQESLHVRVIFLVPKFSHIALSQGYDTSKVDNQDPTVPTALPTVECIHPQYPQIPSNLQYIRFGLDSPSLISSGGR
jgi:hypothetical protein